MIIKKYTSLCKKDYKESDKKEDAIVYIRDSKIETVIK